MRKPVTPRMPRCECEAASAAAPSWPLNRVPRINPLPDGSVVGTHMPNEVTPFASGVAKWYGLYVSFKVEICPLVRQAFALVSEGFGSTSLGQRFAVHGSRVRPPRVTSKMSRHAM